MTGTGQLTCRELAELVTEYLDGALAPADRDAFDAHVEGCRDCGALVDQLRQTIGALRDLPVERLSGCERAELLAALRGSIRAHRS